MSVKAKSRGIKRICQDADCGRPFYDLNRTQFTCPDCGASFDVQAAIRPPLNFEMPVVYRKPGRMFPTPLPVVHKEDVPAEAAETDDAEEVEVAAATDTAPVIGDDDSILEEEDDATAVIVDVEPEPKDRLGE